MVNEPEANPTTTALFEAISLLHRGEREAARRAFSAIFSMLPAADYFHRCVLGHFMADAQDDAESELHWDRLALAAAESAAPAEFDGRFPGMTHASFFPSLLLNVAAGCEKTGRLVEARTFANRGLALPVDETPLGRMTRSGLERLAARVRPESP